MTDNHKTENRGLRGASMEATRKDAFTKANTSAQKISPPEGHAWWDPPTISESQTMPNPASEIAEIRARHERDADFLSCFKQLATTIPSLQEDRATLLAEVERLRAALVELIAAQGGPEKRYDAALLNAIRAAEPRNALEQSNG